MEALEIKTVFTISLFGAEIPITETVIVSWVVMAVLIAGSLLVTRKLKTIPTGPQAILEAGMEFLNNFSKNQFGAFSKYLGAYIGTLFLFLAVANVIGFVTPPEIKLLDIHLLRRFMSAPLQEILMLRRRLR